MRAKTIGSECFEPDHEQTLVELIGSLFGTPECDIAACKPGSIRRSGETSPTPVLNHDSGCTATRTTTYRRVATTSRYSLNPKAVLSIERLCSRMSSVISSLKARCRAADETLPTRLLTRVILAVPMRRAAMLSPTAKGATLGAAAGLTGIAVQQFGTGAELSSPPERERSSGAPEQEFRVSFRHESPGHVVWA